MPTRFSISHARVNGRPAAERPHVLALPVAKLETWMRGERSQALPALRRRQAMLAEKKGRPLRGGLDLS